MSYYQLPSGAYDARLMSNWVRSTAALPIREDAKAVVGSGVRRRPALTTG